MSTTSAPGPPRSATPSNPAADAHGRSIVPRLQRCQERGLRDVDLAELAHLLLALFLLVEELALAADVAAVALGEHVLAQGRDRLARDDAAADRCLDRDLEQLARDQLLELLAQHAAAAVSARAMHDDRQRIDRLGV